MNTSNVQSVLDRVFNDDIPQRLDVSFLLSLTDPQHIQMLFDYADRVRRQFSGDGVLIRGIIEFSSFCKNTCLYCGLNRMNTKLNRYRLSQEQILEAASRINRMGIKTFVLQSGEDDQISTQWLAQLIGKLKTQFPDTAITLSCGERTFEDYQTWKQAGADRYLLKIETADADLYRSLHPGMSFENRVKCLSWLQELGYQAGCGCLVGLKGQTIDTLTTDILFFAEHQFDMLGIGVFIPHPDTSLKQQPLGDILLTMKVLAITRLITKFAHLPATTAIASTSQTDHRIQALKCGANVIMPNFTPDEYKALYEIYPGKKCLNELIEAVMENLNNIVKAAGRFVDLSKGDSKKSQKTMAKCR